MATTSASDIPYQQPPITNILPWIASTLSLVASALVTTVGYTLSIATYLYRLSPHRIVSSFLVPILLYALDPLIIVARLTTHVFFRVPWRFTLDILEQFRPIYSLCGAACLVGAFIGVFGRIVSAVLVKVVADESEEEMEQVVVKE